MKSRRGKRIAAFLTICCLMMMMAMPASAYFDRGTVGVSLGTSEVTLCKGDAKSVSVSFSPSSSEQTEGCGMAECPAICGEKGCLDENGNCTCAGTEYYTYYASADVSSSNSSVATASYADGSVTVHANGEGTATIQVTATLRQYSSSSKTIRVTVTAPPSADTANDDAGKSSSGNRSSGSTGSSGSSVSNGSGGSTGSSTVSSGSGSSTGSSSTGKNSGTGKSSSTGKSNSTGKSSGTIKSSNTDVADTVTVTEQGTTLAQDAGKNQNSAVAEIAVTDAAGAEKTDANDTGTAGTAVSSEDAGEQSPGLNETSESLSVTKEGAPESGQVKAAGDAQQSHAGAVAAVVIAAAAVAVITGVQARKKKTASEAGTKDD